MDKVILSNLTLKMSTGDCLAINMETLKIDNGALWRKNSLK